MENVVQEDELLWKRNFGLSTKGAEIEKEIETVTIKDDRSSG